MDIKEERHYLLQYGNTWCPLFGLIPPIDEIDPSETTVRCVEIIHKARMFLGIQESTSEAFPSLEDVEKYYSYPSNILKPARIIYFRIPEIMWRAQLNSSEHYNEAIPFNDRQPYRDDGKLKVTEDQVDAEWLISEASQTAFIDHKAMVELLNAEATKGTMLFSLYAIYIARDILQSIFIGGKSKDEPELIQRISTAEKIISRVDKSTIIYKFVQIPKIISKKGGHRGGVESGKVRRVKAKSMEEAWQTEADKIWLKHPKWGNSGAARELVKRHGGNIDTIRKSIKKTLP